MKKITFLAISVSILVVLVISVVIYFRSIKKLKWQEEDGHRWAELSVPWFGHSGFQPLTASKTNITFSNNLTREQIASNQHLLNGSGVAVGDVDGDGLADIYLCRLNGPNVLYKNLGGWKFEDITLAAGVSCADQFSTGTAFADIDGDGDIDLLVTTLDGPNFCFLNDGQGTFTDVTSSSGILPNSGAMTLALADIDGDADLDLYITNYKISTVRDLYLPQDLEFDRIVQQVGNEYRVAQGFEEHYTISQMNNNLLMRSENAEPDRLYLNDGRGRFHPVSFTDGRFLDEEGKPISEPKGWGLTARFQDMDADGDPDLYVCNDFESPDRIWINDGSGNFQAIAKLAIRNTSWATMSVGFSDIDRDGDLDFFLLDMLSRNLGRRRRQMTNSIPLPHAVGEIDNRPQNSRNTLFVNRGDNTYAEIAQFSGVNASDWSWSSIFLDVDLDGYEDILIATGHFYDALDLDTTDRIRSTRYTSLNSWRRKIFQFPTLNNANVAFRNRGDLTFEEVGEQWGFNSEDISHGMATGDLDNDGDLDVIINRLNAQVAVLRNKSIAPRLAIRLRGLSPNTQAIGAKIRVLGGAVTQSQEVINAGSYLSSSDPLYVFAANQSDDLIVEVTWRNGNLSRVSHVKTNRIYEISEPDSVTPPPPISAARPESFFEDVSHLLNHVHHEDDHDDFRSQRLLPKKLSQLGPGITWFDFDRDGHDDLFIGSGRGGRMAYFRNNGAGRFQRINLSILDRETEQDQSTILGLTTAQGPSLLIGYSNVGDPNSSRAIVLQYDFGDITGTLRAELANSMSSIGPMTMADYDLDGDLDLFIGGRTLPMRYPEPASSWLYLNDDGEFKLDTLNSAILKDLGLVSGAIFSDVDADGDADLILAVEWGPVTIFENQGGSFTDATEKLGLAKFIGWWQGVATGDLNNDGKLDIIATNWGLNSKYQDLYDWENPLRIFYDDFDNNGTVDIIEAYFDAELQEYVPLRNRQQMSLAIPYVRLRVASHKQYSEASIQQIVGFKMKQSGVLQANTLEHMVFFNRGDRFEATALPAEAQFSPAFYVGVADFDGDGHEDVFLTQNFFGLHTGESRYDAGRGLWLKGDGSGRLVPVPGQESGITIYGEQRGAAFCDYDRDGRVDLAVSQNGAATKLYHNVGAIPGMRIRLSGPEGNPNGVGATIRLVYENGYGPAREVHLGSGYWSQDSTVQVLGLLGHPKSIWVRWPGGKITNVAIPNQARDITLHYDGTLQVHSE